VTSNRILTEVLMSRWQLGLLVTLAAGCAGARDDSSPDDGASCPSDAGVPSSANYSEGVELDCHTLAWAVGQMLEEARASWQPEAFLGSAKCDMEPETGLERNNNCVAYFAALNVEGEHATCTQPARPECEVLADFSDGYQEGDRVGDWRVDSTVAGQLGLEPATADAEMAVYPVRGSGEWVTADGASVLVGTTILAFPGGVVVDGVTGAKLVAAGG